MKIKFQSMTMFSKLMNQREKLSIRWSHITDFLSAKFCTMHSARSKVQPIGETKRQTDTYTEAQMRFRRAISVGCPTWHPFQCPNGDCVPIKYLCDGSPDCGDEYDENKSMCTAG